MDQCLTWSQQVNLSRMVGDFVQGDFVRGGFVRGDFVLEPSCNMKILLTGLHIYTGEYKAQDTTKGRALRGP